MERGNVTIEVFRCEGFRGLSSTAFSALLSTLALSAAPELWRLRGGL